ncbi:MAG TPA: WYL domain-containing protein [Roseimicrobium sp.]|nr:WYL domain-containing protein [Roseimicrobium sp.]
MSESDHLPHIVDLASRRRLIALEYEKPWEDTTTRRVVEPYQLQQSSDNLMLLCWQIDPPMSEQEAWRHFRLDRIVDLGDGGSEFEPRTPITICSGEVHEFVMGRTPTSSESPAPPPPDPLSIAGLSLPTRQYLVCLRNIIADKLVTPAEMERAKARRAACTDAEIKTAHAKLFSEALAEALMDGELSGSEECYLRRVRGLLKLLGYAP